MILRSTLSCWPVRNCSRVAAVVTKPRGRGKMGGGGTLVTEGSVFAFDAAEEQAPKNCRWAVKANRELELALEQLSRPAGGGKRRRTDASAGEASPAAQVGGGFHGKK